MAVLCLGTAAIDGGHTNPMEKTMTISLNFLSLMSSVAAFADRLTTVFRRGGARGAPRQGRLQSSHAPPRIERGRGLTRLGAYRLRIVTIRPGDLSPHLRRDIGLDL
jgi:hypothetical protein